MTYARPPSYVQFRMARVAIGLDIRSVAASIGMSYRGVQAVETSAGNPTAKTSTKLLTFYEAQGVEFSPDGWVRLAPASKPQETSVVNLSTDSLTPKPQTQENSHD